VLCNCRVSARISAVSVDAGESVECDASYFGSPRISLQSQPSLTATSGWYSPVSANPRAAWEECQASQDRNAIYGYLSAVFDLVMWWAAEGRAISRARWALQLQHLDLPSTDEPFAAVIRCTSDPAKVDKQTRSKWSCVLRYAMEYKPSSEPLAAFIRRGSTSVQRDLPAASGCVIAPEERPGVDVLSLPSAQCSLARMIASERAPTSMRLSAQVASRLNQLRDTNLRPR
jgi:hypothetical protein